jgi:hypothetical protein
MLGSFRITDAAAPTRPSGIEADGSRAAAPRAGSSCAALEQPE